MAHRRLVQAQAGFSLGDIYDVVGSVVGIRSLDMDEVKAVHELGATIFSERLNANLNMMDSTSILQNVSFNIELVGFRPDVPQRLLGVSVLSNTTARLTRASLSIRGQPATSPELVFWAWDSAADPETEVRWSDNGAAVATFFMLTPLALSAIMPTMLIRLGVGALMPSIFFRGTSSGFGAGNVRVRAILHFARPMPPLVAAGDPSSHGLPLPSW